MTTMGKKELIKSIKTRYRRVTRLEKGKILDEFCLNTGYHRNIPCYQMLISKIFLPNSINSSFLVVGSP